MKKLIPLFVILLGISSLLNAQCTPDYTCDTLICPDSATNLPNAMENAAYETTLTFHPSTSLTISGYSVTLDSVVFIEITGLPTGFSYSYLCNNADTVIYPDSFACAKISGTTSDTGTYNIVIRTRLHGSVYGMTGEYEYLISDYRIIVEEDSTSSLQENINKTYNVKNVPNPFSNETSIYYTLNKPQKVKIIISDVLGNKIKVIDRKSNIGENSIKFDATGLSKGIYFYTISTEHQNITKKMLFN